MFDPKKTFKSYKRCKQWRGGIAVGRRAYYHAVVGLTTGWVAIK